MSYIRDHYQVPAKRGRRVVFDGKPGRITSARGPGAYLNVRLDGEKHPVPVHPRWRVTYLDADGKTLLATGD